MIQPLLFKFSMAAIKLSVRHSASPHMLSFRVAHRISPAWAHRLKYYHSRAHPTRIPEYALPEALQRVLDNCKDHQTKIQGKIDRYKDPGRKTLDETIELILNLNVDPRKPGQSLRGTIFLPHGTGKAQAKCIVFCEDPEVAKACIEAGATHAGGQSLIEEIVAGQLNLQAIDVGMGTKDMMGPLGRSAARILGPRGLMPNAKVGTLVEESELIDTIVSKISGNETTFRTEREGIVHMGVGKASFGLDPLLENIGAAIQTVYESKPESYGKGKQKKNAKNPPFVARASLSSTQSPGQRLDLRTVDPSSRYFLKSLEEEVLQAT